MTCALYEHVCRVIIRTVRPACLPSYHSYVLHHSARVDPFISSLCKAKENFCIVRMMGNYMYFSLSYYVYV